MNKIFLFLFPFLSLIIACNSEPALPKVNFQEFSETDKRKPENAIHSMSVHSGLRVNQFAAEPMIVNPTNIDIDHKGRIWMCEATNYRMRFNPKNPYRESGDRILILEDEDGDGIADSKKVFYEGEEINSALGIAVLGNTVYVSHSPSILMLTDTDGDDVADTKDTLFTGFGGIQDDHGVHAISFGMDGKLYFNFGNAGKQILYKDGTPVLDRDGRVIKTGTRYYREGMVFRCNPDGSQLEVVGHNFRNMYEVAVDSYGNKWQSDNDDDGNKAVRINYVMDYGNYGYKDEITGDSWNVRRINMHEEIPKRHWHLNDPGVVPNLLQTGSGSPCGMLVYEGELLPTIFQNQMIHCEAGHQVVRSYPVQKDGAGFKAEMVDLLKSEDKWFRPSDVCTAPDGSIFVSDWYDAVVGGNEMDDYQRGRIYRIAPKGKDYKTTPLDMTTVEGAIEALKNPNLSTRYLGWTALNKAGKIAEPLLSELYEKGKPIHQARAFYLLARIPGRTEYHIARALKNKNPDIRIAALRAARDLMPEKINYFASLVVDDVVEVRREAAISLRFTTGSDAAKTWTRLALKYDGKDRWYLEALGIGADKNPELKFRTLFGHVEATEPFEPLWEIAWRIRTPYAIAMMRNAIRNPDVKEEDLPKYFRAFHFYTGAEKEQELLILLNGNHRFQNKINQYALGQMSNGFLKINKTARAKVTAFLPDIKGTPEWISAIVALEQIEQIPELWKMILNNSHPDLQSELIDAFFNLGGEKLASDALQNAEPLAFNKILSILGPINNKACIDVLKNNLDRSDLDIRQRKKIVESLGNSWDGVHYLYELAKSGKLDKELHTTAALKMMTCWDTEVRWYGPKLLDAATGNKGKMLPPIDDLIDLKGTIASGEKSFNEYCSSCHMVNDRGIRFGPDLSEIGNKLSKKALFSAIIYPSGGITYGYEGFILKDKTGTPYTGYIESQNEQEIVLRMTGGFSKVFQKPKVVSLDPMDASLMTANLQRVMSQQALVDLVAYLSSLKKE